MRLFHPIAQHEGRQQAATLLGLGLVRGIRSLDIVGDGLARMRLLVLLGLDVVGSVGRLHVGDGLASVTRRLRHGFERGSKRFKAAIWATIKSPSILSPLS